MTTAQTRQEMAEANRRRYEELRAAGQEVTPKGLPDATALNGAPIAPDAVDQPRAGPRGLVHNRSSAARRGAADCR